MGGASWGPGLVSGLLLLHSAELPDSCRMRDLAVVVVVGVGAVLWSSLHKKIIQKCIFLFTVQFSLFWRCGASG